MEPSREEKMHVADEIMRKDQDALRALAEIDEQMEVARKVMEQRRGALSKLAESDRS